MNSYFEEFRDDEYQGSAVESLNLFIQNNPSFKIKDVKYNVVRYEQLNQERTYILVEVER